MKEISRRAVLKGLALIVTGLPVISTNSAYSQSREIRQEDVFASYDEFVDALINKKQGNDYLRKLEYAHNNPNVAIQLFDKDRKSKYNSIKYKYYPHQRVAHSFGEAIGQNFSDALSGNIDDFELYISSAFALKEEMGVKFKINHKNPGISDLTSMTILTYDLFDLYPSRNTNNQEIKDIIKRIFDRARVIKKMGFEGFKRDYK